ncbi:hypothetical protein ACIPUB_04980 [Paeniglutamicibacter sp. ORCA_105]|uniref:hypothetical protein n=1 Tax=Paeniglutamicibacter sp. ORCA_105 TaxID=3377336 RepID=UPI0038933B9D
MSVEDADLGSITCDVQNPFHSVSTTILITAPGCGPLCCARHWSVALPHVRASHGRL